MKKRFPALLLALVLCLGLAVPAFAADPTPVEIGNITLSDVIVTDKYDNAKTLMDEFFGEEGAPASYEFQYELGMIGFLDEETKEYGYSTFWSYLLPEDAVISVRVTKEVPSIDIIAYTLEEAETEHWKTTLIAGFTGSLGEGKDEDSSSITKEDLQNSLKAGGLDPEFDVLWIGTSWEDYILVCFGDPYDAPAEPETPDTTEPDTTDEPTEPAAPVFTDVPSWCADSTAWAVEKKVTNGYGSADKFAPSVECKQSEILTFLYRAVRGVEAEGEIPAASGEDMALAEDWAREKGIIDDEFDGNAPCTRATAVSYIWQALDTPKAEEAASFTDVEADSPYTAAINWAVENEVTKGYGGSDTFAPDRTCNRGEIVTCLYRAYEN